VNALAPVAPKLAKLIPLLSSDKDGEVLATARAIDRTLRGAGLDLHALAAQLGAEPETRIVDREPPQRDPQTWGEVARWCRDTERGRLADHERRFVRDMAARLVCGGSPTERQGAWLRALYAKVRATS
jgi:hypothetical protein